MRHVGIIGANVAGLGVARGLRDAGYDGAITLFDRDRDAMIDRPALSKSSLVVGTPPPPIPGSGDLDRLGVTFELAEVCALDPAGRAIHLADGSRVDCDAAALCTGADAKRPEWLSSLGPNGRYVLRSAADARALSRALEEARHVAVVGGGLIGMEAAAAIRMRGIDVTVIEAQPAPMMRAFGEACGRHVAAVHRKYGVALKLETKIRDAAVIPRGIALECDDGDRVEADIAIAALGSVPRTALAVAAGLATADGIIVDAFGRTSTPWIFAAGDVARYPASGGLTRSENIQHGFRHGFAVGRSIAGQAAPYAEIQTYWSDQFECTIQACGSIEGTPTVIREGEDRFLAFWQDGPALAGVVAIDSGGEIAAARRMIERRAPLDTAALARGVSLRELARAKA